MCALGPGCSPWALSIPLGTATATGEGGWREVPRGHGDPRGQAAGPATQPATRNLWAPLARPVKGALLCPASGSTGVRNSDAPSRYAARDSGACTSGAGDSVVVLQLHLPTHSPSPPQPPRGRRSHCCHRACSPRDF